jgi:ribosomal-protein-alanine N-acetyltransferase
VANGTAVDAALAFRTMTLADLDVVMRNETRAYAFPWTPGLFADSIAGADDGRVVLLGEAVIGHGILSFGAGEAHVLNVCIARAHQGRGHGRLLLDHLLDRARDRGASVVFLEVRLSNRVALELYSSVGFREIGRRRDYYPSDTGPEDARVMCLEFT